MGAKPFTFLAAATGHIHHVATARLVLEYGVDGVHHARFRRETVDAEEDARRPVDFGLHLPRLD